MSERVLRRQLLRGMGWFALAKAALLDVIRLFVVPSPVQSVTRENSRLYSQ